MERTDSLAGRTDEQGRLGHLTKEEEVRMTYEHKT